MKKCYNIFIMNIFFAAIISLLLTSCNQAPVGYGAPFGSTVSISEDASYTVPVGTTQVAVVSGSVVLPQANVGQGDQQQQSGDQQQQGQLQQNPGNNIYVKLTCFGCEFINENSESLGTVLETTTNSSGIYVAYVLLQSPAQTGLDQYEANVTADITVANASTKITVLDSN
ncbi:hypothetical protein MRY82_07950 [bacterium]|nr:hypothetical protein [bacterium]